MLRNFNLPSKRVQGSPNQFFDLRRPTIFARGVRSATWNWLQASISPTLTLAAVAATVTTTRSRRSEKKAATAPRKASKSRRGKLRAMMLPMPGPAGDWLYGVSSGFRELDQHVRAVPGEVTLIEVAKGALNSHDSAAVSFVLSLVAGLARKAGWHFDIRSDVLEREVIGARLQRFLSFVSGEEAIQTTPDELLLDIFRYFRIHNEEPWAVFLNCIDREALRSLSPNDALMRGSSSSRQSLVLLRKKVDEDAFGVYEAAVSMKSMAKECNSHIFVVRFLPCQWMQDHFQEKFDNRLVISKDKETSCVKVRVEKVRNRHAGVSTTNALFLALPGFGC